MGLVEWVNKQKVVPFYKMLNFYPPFFFFGAKVSFSDNYRKIMLKLPLRWYYKNNNGTMFGGAVSMLSDPFPALVFEKIFDHVSVWTKAQHIKYLNPAKTTIVAKIEISDEDIADLKQQLEENGKAEKTFSYYFIDKKGKNIAFVSNTVYLRMR